MLSVIWKINIILKSCFSNNAEDTLQAMLYSEKVIIWCALHVVGNIGLYFFKIPNGAGLRYKMLVA